jgi:T4 gene Gp59 loader of gp41 DNA helicase
MTPFEAFKLYTAIKNHFTTESYDYFKYNGKVRASEHSFETRKDKYMFYKLSKHEDPLTFLVSNFAEGKKLWVGDLFDLDKQLAYNEFLRRKQSLTYIFESDIDNLLEEFDKNFEVPEGGYPHLLNLLVRKKLSKETFIIIQDCVRFFTKWNKQITDPVLWPQIALNCKKLHPFLEYDKDKYCGILRKKFS